MDKYQQALHDAIFGDTWEKFVSHPEFPRWASYVKLLKSPKNDNIEGTERMIHVLGEMILQDIGARTVIDNFKVIDNFLQFEEGTFYKFELLVRNTDGENELFPERCSNTNRNILIKSWYVDTREYYEKIKHEMVTLSNITGARLYVTLDRKDNVKLVNSLLHSLSDTLTAIVIGQNPSIKKISKVIASETSKVENSSKGTKTLMWDVDTKQIEIVNHVHEYIRSKGQEPFTLKTKKGYHVVCFRKFNHADWLDWCVEHEYKHTEFENKIAEKDFKTTYKNLFQGLVSVKENELGLVYHPMKGIE